jgi:ADP-ribosylglycohydrolase/protein-tyrosine phosphatase
VTFFMCSQLKADYPIPFPRSYWVIPGVFLAGEFPGSKAAGKARQKLKRLYDAGIRHVINLMEPDEIDHDGNPFDSYKNDLTEIAEKQDDIISFSRYPIKDLHIPDSDQMTAILDAIDAAIEAHQPVYVHCWGGIGRTGTVVGCFLIRHGLATSRNVLDVIHGLRKNDPKNYRTSPETSVQVKFVASWQKHDAARHIRLDRYLGCLAGLAAGDAVGTTLEFKLPGSFSPIDDMIGGGPFGLKPGQWTDDTSMALCLADSLIQCNGFDAADQMKRYCRWRDQGYLSSIGECFDIGGTVSSALSRFQETGDPFAGSTHERSAGNGSIMRLAPVPLFYGGHPETAIQMSAESSKTTHGARTCIDACRYLSGLIIGALTGESRETLLGPRYAPVKNLWGADPLCPEIDEIARGSFKTKNPPEIKGTGYVVQSLEAALWAFYHSSCFEDGCLMAVNLGDDADTTGAVYGQLAGAFYGFKSIPPKWRDMIAHKDMIADFAVKLWLSTNAENRFLSENKAASGSMHS